MSIRDRIRERLEALEKSARAASVEAGLSTHFLQRFFADPDTSMRVDNLENIATVLKTSPEWLLTGRGDKERDPSAAKIVDIWDRIPERFRERALNSLEAWTDDEKEA